MPVDPNEPTYCLCHQVSYGEMIGCDNPDVSSFVGRGQDWVIVIDKKEYIILKVIDFGCCTLF